MAKKPTSLQLNLAPTPAVAQVLEAPAMEKLVEYMVDGVSWRCGVFDLLVAELGQGFHKGQMPLFHSMVCTHERSWLIVRRLFGLQPVVPPANYSLEDMRVWDRDGLRSALGISKAQLQQELDGVRGAWTTVAPKASPAVIAGPPEQREELNFADDEVLKQHGFKIRADSEQRMWFCSRIRELAPILNEKLTSGLARNMAMTELQLRQLDDYMTDPVLCKTGTAEWYKSQKARQDLDKIYREQIKQIADLAPWFSNLAGKHAFKDVLSEITRGIQNFYARGDRGLVDGIFTATEIQVELRMSVQTPAVRYRAGLIVYLTAAKANLWDNNWRGEIDSGTLKKMDAGFKAAAEVIAIDSGESIPDLEKTGPEGEYKSLKKEELT